jgi:transcriptional regulator with XRE-family HTH domain
MSKPPGKRGRPTVCTDKLRQIILHHAKKGKTIEQLSKLICVSPTTIKNWMGGNPDFLAALNAARNVADELVEQSLFQRACGYSHEAVKLFYDKDLGKVIEHKYIEHYPPDPTAMIFWLKNRQSENWRERPEASNDEIELPQPVYVLIANPTDKTPT